MNTMLRFVQSTSGAFMLVMALAVAISVSQFGGPALSDTVHEEGFVLQNTSILRSAN